MSNVLIWMHCVWATKSRHPFITEINRQDILEHIQANAQVKGIHLDFINAHKDHVHCLISLNSDQSIGKVVHLLKGESTKWINKNLQMEQPFEWSVDFYAASISYSRVDVVRNYIKNQDLHHATHTWPDEEARFQLLTNPEGRLKAQAQG